MNIPKRKVTLIIRMIIWVIVVFAISIICARGKLNGIAEEYTAKIVLKETIVFDEPEVVNKYGHDLTLNAGMRGTISDSIHYYGIQRTECEYIETELHQEDGSNIPVLLTFDQGYEKAVLPSEDIVHATHDKYVLVIDISKIEDAENILSGYKETREKYYTSIRNTIIASAIISLSITIAGIAVIVFLYIKGRKTDSEIKS